MIDYDRTAADHSASRDLTLPALEGWRVALRPYLPPARGMPILDLGAGTGTFTRAFATWYGIEVVAVEPSEGMRSEMRARGLPKGVRLVVGSGEELPLLEKSCGAAWLSTVIHHLRDLPRTATNLRRVIAIDGHVLIRSVFPDATDGVTLFRFFPAARRVAATFPSVERLSAVLGNAGFRLLAREQVAQQSHPSLAAFHRGVLRRADTTLLSISDDDYRDGLDQLWAAVQLEFSPSPVVDTLDLVVFGCA